MKILLLLNQSQLNSHTDVYNAMKMLKNNNEIEQFYVIPFLYKLENGSLIKDIQNEIQRYVNDYSIDIIIFLHTVGIKFNYSFLTTLKEKNSLVYGYWDGDLYESPYRPVPKEIIALAQICDVVFFQGFGETTDKLKENGIKDIRFVPAFGDDDKFYPDFNIKKEIDIVLIGNNITSRNPFRITMQGTRSRKKIVRALAKKYDDKFAVYGANWKNTSSKGCISYDLQHKIYNVSRLSVAVNNYTGRFYFSDRLPIALLSGCPIVHNYEEGFDFLFKQLPELLFFKEEKEAFEMIENLLALSQEERNSIGKKISSYAKEKFTAKIAFKYMVDVMKYYHMIKIQKKETFDILNPWLINDETNTVGII